MSHIARDSIPNSHFIGPPLILRPERANKSAKPSDEDVPDNVKALLQGFGDIFAGKSIVISGVPPVIGRKNADKLVELYGKQIFLF